MKNCYGEEIDFKIGHFERSNPIPYLLENHWLMPGRFLQNVWHFSLTSDHERVINHNHLPSELIWRFVFIQAWGLPILEDQKLRGEIELFNPPANFDVMDIGWRVSDSWFTFIVEESFLIDFFKPTHFFKNKFIK